MMFRIDRKVRINPNETQDCKQILFFTQSRKERKYCKFVYSFLCDIAALRETLKNVCKKNKVFHYNRII